MLRKDKFGRFFSTDFRTASIVLFFLLIVAGAVAALFLYAFWVLGEFLVLTLRRKSGKGRPLRTSEDSTGETSFETYLRGELKTYSARTITLLHELTLRQQQDGVNGAALNLLNQVQQYGYATLEQAEGHRAGG